MIKGDIYNFSDYTGTDWKISEIPGEDLTAQLFYAIRHIAPGDALDLEGKTIEIDDRDSPRGFHFMNNVLYYSSVPGATLKRAANMPNHHFNVRTRVVDDAGPPTVYKNITFDGNMENQGVNPWEIFQDLDPDQKIRYESQHAQWSVNGVHKFEDCIMQNALGDGITISGANNFFYDVEYYQCQAINCLRGGLTQVSGPTRALVDQCDLSTLRCDIEYTGENRNDTEIRNSYMSLLEIIGPASGELKCSEITLCDGYNLGAPTRLAEPVSAGTSTLPVEANRLILGHKSAISYQIIEPNTAREEVVTVQGKGTTSTTYALDGTTTHYHPKGSVLQSMKGYSLYARGFEYQEFRNCDLRGIQPNHQGEIPTYVREYTAGGLTGRGQLNNFPREVLFEDCVLPPLDVLPGETLGTIIFRRCLFTEKDGYHIIVRNDNRARMVFENCYPSRIKIIRRAGTKISYNRSIFSGLRSFLRW